MLENPGFARWFRDDFLARYPIPARNQIPISPLLGDAHGLSWIGEQRFSDDVRMSLETFVDYELSTTNIIATVGLNPAALERAQAWLAASVAPLFRHREAGTFRFVGKVWCLRKLAPDVLG
jgi:hypothetical protein